MDFSVLYDSEVFKLVALPILIFMTRIVDVSLGTIRIIYISRGMKYLAPLFGFFEVLIWLLALGHIMKNLTNEIYYAAYAGGFAMGNFVGIQIEQKLAMGKVVIRIITGKDCSELVQKLISRGYGITNVDAQGSQGPVKIIFTIVSRRAAEAVVKLIEECNPKAFYTIEEVKTAREGTFPEARQ